jgi:alkanesulfonate monooxygenase SsuD/methylene tetrahydromethanopterin reductase-like flavin-dependent oxidoreductase (luciferase family)
VRIGVGLPNTMLDVPGRLLVDWARRAEARGFSSLATIDRVAYPSYDSLTALTAAAAVTERIGLLTNVLLAPLYNPVLLAKVTACLDQISEGRLTLGLGVGGRPDDYQLVERGFSDRGRRFDADLELLHQAWAGAPVPGSPFQVGPGPGAAADRRAGGAGRPAGGPLGGRLHHRRRPAGDGRRRHPGVQGRLRAGRRHRDPAGRRLSYYSLGEEHTETSRRNLRSYYGFLGDWAEGIASGTPRTPEALRHTATAFEELGVDELIFDPTVPDLDQIDRLAEVVPPG